MPSRPITRHFREGATTDISMVIGFVAAVMLALFLLFAPRWFSGEKSVDVVQTQPSIEAPVTGSPN